MSMQYSDSFPRTCPCLTPRLGNLQSGLSKAKGQIQWSNLDTGGLVPSMSLTHSQEPWSRGIFWWPWCFLCIPGQPASTKRQVRLSAAAEKSRAPAASSNFTAPTARILSNKSPQRLHAAELDALKLVPDQNPMEGKALAQARVTLSQLKFAEHYHRARRFQQVPPETLRSVSGAGHRRRASPVESHDCSTIPKPCTSNKSPSRLTVLLQQQQ